MSDILSKAFLLKFIKFGVIGFSGLFVDYGFTFLCKEVLKINKYISNSIGFLLAASSNYYLNRIWTFKSENPNIAEEYTTFIIISLIGLVINNLILWQILKRFKINFYFAKAFAIAVVIIRNFLANAFITFS